MCMDVISMLWLSVLATDHGTITEHIRGFWVFNVRGSHMASVASAWPWARWQALMVHRRCGSVMCRRWRLRQWRDGSLAANRVRPCGSGEQGWRRKEERHQQLGGSENPRRENELAQELSKLGNKSNSVEIQENSKFWNFLGCFKLPSLKIILSQRFTQSTEWVGKIKLAAILIHFFSSCPSLRVNFM